MIRSRHGRGMRAPRCSRRSRAAAAGGRDRHGRRDGQLRARVRCAQLLTGCAHLVQGRRRPGSFRGSTAPGCECSPSYARRAAAPATDWSRSREKSPHEPITDGPPRRFHVKVELVEPRPRGSARKEAAMSRDATKIQGAIGARQALAPLSACLAVALSLATLAACGGGGGSGGGGTVTEPPPVTGDCVGAQSFRSTFEGIQKVIFENHGCTRASATAAASRAASIFRPTWPTRISSRCRRLGSRLNASSPATRPQLPLAQARGQDRSGPASTIAGAPMPNGLPRSARTSSSCCACGSMPARPDRHGRRDRDAARCAAATGGADHHQAARPAGAGRGRAVRHAAVEARSAQRARDLLRHVLRHQRPGARGVPDPSGTLFRFSGQDLRQDPQSHHLILNATSACRWRDIHDPAFGAWTCNGGENAGQICEPTDLDLVRQRHLHQRDPAVLRLRRLRAARPRAPIVTADRRRAGSRRPTAATRRGVRADPDEGHPLLEHARLQPDGRGHDACTPG